MRALVARGAGEAVLSLDLLYELDLLGFGGDEAAEGLAAFFEDLRLHLSDVDVGLEERGFVLFVFLLVWKLGCLGV